MSPYDFDAGREEWLTCVRSRVVFYMLVGWSVDALGIIAAEVLRPKGLVGFGLDMVDHSGPEIATVGTR